MARQKPTGTCQLTGEVGPFVDSHLIPLALTRLSVTGSKHVETGIGLGAKHRSSSWYDGQLVTRAGEDILAAIDSAGIDELRRHRLVWSGWWPDLALEAEDFVLRESKPWLRKVRIDNPTLLQLFFLSLLWRAGASRRPEFAQIALGDEVLTDLRLRLVSRDPGRFEDYPTQLFQVITPGVRHNRTPLLERKQTLDLSLAPGPEISYVRFYFDGLVAHVHLALGQQLPQDYLRTCLGLSEKTIVFVHDYKTSRTARDMAEMVRTVLQELMTPTSPKNQIATAIDAAWPSASLLSGISTA
jgi:hypothetical protein